jgi:hypothetical protein
MAARQLTNPAHGLRLACSLATTLPSLPNTGTVADLSKHQYDDGRPGSHWFQLWQGYALDVVAPLQAVVALMVFSGLVKVCLSVMEIYRNRQIAPHFAIELGANDMSVVVPFSLLPHTRYQYQFFIGKSSLSAKVHGLLRPSLCMLWPGLVFTDVETSTSANPDVRAVPLSWR